MSFGIAKQDDTIKMNKSNLTVINNLVISNNDEMTNNV
jgi:hypothetical protein